MSAERTCYNCAHLTVCRLQDAVNRAISDHLFMVNVDLPSSDPNNWTKIFGPVARACRMYVERVEIASKK